MYAFNFRLFTFIFCALAWPALTANLQAQAIKDTPAIVHFEAGLAAYQANDLTLAYTEFLRSANVGHSDSQFNVALMYENGIGVDKDLQQALAWYRKAAFNGNSAAQYNLAVFYENGRGTGVDFTEANEWYRSAALQGDPMAIGNLGMLYMRGDGVAVNKVAGIALLLRSATLDPSPTNNAKRNISGTRGLTPQIITEAQELADRMSKVKNMLIPLDQHLILSAASKAAGY